jgi:hypothetical protein
MPTIPNANADAAEAPPAQARQQLQLAAGRTLEFRLPPDLDVAAIGFLSAAAAPADLPASSAPRPPTAPNAVIVLADTRQRIWAWSGPGARPRPLLRRLFSSVSCFAQTLSGLCDGYDASCLADATTTTFADGRGGAAVPTTTSRVIRCGFINGTVGAVDLRTHGLCNIGLHRTRIHAVFAPPPPSFFPEATPVLAPRTHSPVAWGSDDDGPRYSYALTLGPASLSPLPRGLKPQTSQNCHLWRSIAADGTVMHWDERVPLKPLWEARTGINFFDAATDQAGRAGEHIAGGGGGGFVMDPPTFGPHVAYTTDGQYGFMLRDSGRRVALFDGGAGGGSGDILSWALPDTFVAAAPSVTHLAIAASIDDVGLPACAITNGTTFQYLDVNA